MNRKTILGLLALIIVVAGLLWYAGASQPPEEAAATPITLPSTGYAEHAPYYDIAANYATTTPLAGDASAAAIATMEDFVSATIATFKKDGNFDNLTPQDISAMGFDKGRKESLNIIYLISSSPHTVSYIFTVYQDTGGAHPNASFKTFTFDTATGAELSLADLFSANSDYLGTLSTIARAQLPAQIGSELLNASMLAAGTVPNEQDFQDWFVDNGTLDILFDPYAVAPYAAGPQTLQIPLSQLKTILKPEYQ